MNWKLDCCANTAELHRSAAAAAKSLKEGRFIGETSGMDVGQETCGKIDRPPRGTPEVNFIFSGGRIVATRHRCGSGMGLAICKEIVEMHGGHIAAESDGASGTVFSVVLPSADESLSLPA